MIKVQQLEKVAQSWDLDAINHSIVAVEEHISRNNFAITIEAVECLGALLGARSRIVSK